MSEAQFMQSFLRERYDKDMKYYHVYDNYRPNYKEQMITRKFYSKYERRSLNVDPEIVKAIKKHNFATCREKYAWPATENQWYGWFSTLLTDLDRADDRFYHPKKGSDFVKHELRLKQDESDFPNPKFTGVPFKLSFR